MKLLKEPLVHFLVLGAGLFVLHGLVSDPGAGGEGDRQIVISAGRVEQLSRIFHKTWQRSPTKEELVALVDEYVLEEIYYRQAVAMGIDRDDTIIRRRMRQKLEFLTEDLTAPAPTDQDLQAYLAANADKFRPDTRYTFEQVYVNPERHRDRLGQFVAGQLEALRAGGQAEVGSALLPPAFVDEPAHVIDGTFGTGFAAALDGLPLQGEWQGPVPSGLGVHLIKLDAREVPPPPTLDQVRAAVEREWAYQEQQSTKEQIHTGMRAQYDIVVEWPEDEE